MATAQGVPQGGPPPGPVVNPAMQSLLDSLPHTQVPFKLITTTMQGTQPPQTNTVAVCPEHQFSLCQPCGVDFNTLNYMHQFLKNAPQDAVPPPPNVPPAPQRAEMIKNAKEAGNVSFFSSCALLLMPKTAFKSQNFPAAIQHYSKSADMALSRPPWEQAVISRDETVLALCNRSAAFAIVGAWANALADAEAVVALKRPWTKGHFRKARALVGLGRLDDARDALVDGLQFEPNDKELNAFLEEIDQKIRDADEPSSAAAVKTEEVVNESTESSI